MDITKISVIGGLLISFTAIVGNVLITIINKRNEYKSNIYTALLDIAYKEYEFNSNKVKEIAEKEGKSCDFYPFADYLIHYSELAKLLMTSKIKESDIESFVREDKKLRKHYNDCKKTFESQ